MADVGKTGAPPPTPAAPVAGPSSPSLGVIIAIVAVVVSTSKFFFVCKCFIYLFSSVSVPCILQCLRLSLCVCVYIPSPFLSPRMVRQFSAATSSPLHPHNQKMTSANWQDPWKAWKRLIMILRLCGWKWSLLCPRLHFGPLGTLYTIITSHAVLWFLETDRGAGRGKDAKGTIKILDTDFTSDLVHFLHNIVGAHSSTKHWGCSATPKEILSYSYVHMKYLTDKEVHHFDWS